MGYMSLPRLWSQVTQCMKMAPSEGLAQLHGSIFNIIHVSLNLYNLLSASVMVLCRPSDRVRKKIENYAEIFSNIMWKKVPIMQKRCQIMQKFLKLIKLFPWLFSLCKIHFIILPRIWVLYDMFDLLLPFMERYFFVQHSFSLVFVVNFVQSFVTRH